MGLIHSHPIITTRVVGMGAWPWVTTTTRLLASRLSLWLCMSSKRRAREVKNWPSSNPSSKSTCNLRRPKVRLSCRLLKCHCRQLSWSKRWRSTQGRILQPTHLPKGRSYRRWAITKWARQWPQWVWLSRLAVVCHPRQRQREQSVGPLWGRKRQRRSSSETLYIKSNHKALDPLYKANWLWLNDWWR